MTLETLLNNGVIWLASVAVLFVATNATLAESVKPFLHTLIDSVGWLETHEEDVKPFLVRASAIFVAYMIALPLNEVYNMPVVVFGRYAHPALGILPAVFAAVFFGRQIHDRWGKDDNAPTPA